jgi:hypothetical protein
MPIELLSFILQVKSSYKQNLELPLSGEADVPDTLQLCISSDGSWRIKTFGIDHDIHTYKLGGDSSKHIAIMAEITWKHYGDIIALEHRFKFKNCLDKAETTVAFSRVGLEPNLEVYRNQHAFWKPDEAAYVTQSRPEEEQ